MTPIAGGVALNLAFGFSILTVFTLFLHTRNGDQRLFLTGQRLALGISFFVFLATFILTFQLIQSNFDIDYVARYTSLETPFIYKISALWAGQSGSLLFWLFILSIYTTIVILLNQRKHKRETPGDDDGSFIKAGFPIAIMNVGSFPYADPNYHLETDIPELVDIQNLWMSTQASLAAGLSVDLGEM